VYSSESIRRVMMLTAREGFDFDVVSNPEFLREGTAVTDFLYPDRIVVGADSERARCILRDVYRPLTSGSYYSQPERIPEPATPPAGATLIETSAKSAELIKHASNAFLALKISFMNAVSRLCEAVQADIEEVKRGLGSDHRIGSAFLNAGIGYGGSCFPKDVSAFRSVSEQMGCSFGLLDEVIKINAEQRRSYVRKVKHALWTLRGKRLAALGLAFKGGTDDVRESPAIDIIQMLLTERCSIVAYDPAATDRAREILKDSISYAHDPYEAAEGADALLILTDWEDFSSLDMSRLKKALRQPVVIDGRNLYDCDTMQRHGFFYVSVGRPAVKPVSLSSCSTTDADVSSINR
jgi:UDPglucose 6-dehydrogenase